MTSRWKRPSRRSATTSSSLSGRSPRPGRRRARPAEPGAVIRPEPAAARAPIDHGTTPDRDHRGDHQADHRHAAEPAGGVHPAPAAAAAAAAPRHHGRPRTRSTGRPASCSRSARADRRPHGAAGRPGHPPRHVRPAARGARGPAHRRGVHPAAAVQLGQRQVPRLRLAAVGVRGGRLRVRLLGRQARTRWSAGKPSSATSSTARRRSWTSSSAPASRSGASAPASCCCCRTATRARAPTTPRPGSSGS